MGDIFDEVDDILNELESVESHSEITDSTEENFNDSELQDIMAEIESLESESEPAPIEVKTTSLQDEIDRELEMSFQNETTAEAEPKILSFEKKSAMVSTPISSTVTSSDISFSAHGQMNLNLEFKIGNETAKLVIDPIKGLIITMTGVELCINQEEGCKVSMESGVKFTIPTTSSESFSKKKIA